MEFTRLPISTLLNVLPVLLAILFERTNFTGFQAFGEVGAPSVVDAFKTDGAAPFVVDVFVEALSGGLEVLETGASILAGCIRRATWMRHP
jgi:hypothetical protein